MKKRIFSRESRGSRKSKESNRSIKSISSIFSILLLAATAARAGSDGAQSAAFRVDTRAATSVKVTGVASRYCDGAYGSGGRHVYFLAGVGLNVSFTAQVDWGGRTGNRLEFNGVNNGLNYAKTLNVGTLGAGGKLEVVAVATDGTRSSVFRANFDVAPLPPFANMVFYAPWRPGASDLVYLTPEFNLHAFHAPATWIVLPSRATVRQKMRSSHGRSGRRSKITSQPSFAPQVSM